MITHITAAFVFNWSRVVKSSVVNALPVVLFKRKCTLSAMLEILPFLVMDALVGGARGRLGPQVLKICFKGGLRGGPTIQAIVNF